MRRVRRYEAGLCDSTWFSPLPLLELPARQTQHEADHVANSGFVIVGVWIERPGETVEIGLQIIYDDAILGFGEVALEQHFVENRNHSGSTETLGGIDEVSYVPFVPSATKCVDCKEKEKLGLA